MTGGMARIFILGRNAPDNEPWPDVIGFSIIFIVSVMFMLGLEVSEILFVTEHIFSCSFRLTDPLTRSALLFYCTNRIQRCFHTFCCQVCAV